MRKKFITFNLTGGIGNQLFGYVAGLYISKLKGFEVRFDLSAINKSFTKHGSTISSLQFEEMYKSTTGNEVKRTNQIFTDKLLNFEIQSRLPFLRFLNKPLKVHMAKEVGFDPTLESVTAGSTVIGYFQTYKYLFKLMELGYHHGLSLLNPSDEFNKLLAESKINSPLMVHIRRGDYLKLPRIGTLSFEYYKKAIETLLDEFNLGDCEIWIFSDDIKQVENRFPKSQELNIRFIHELQNLDPAESLVLMANGSGNVISNSTYSWWAAISNNSSRVIAPSKWFKDMEDPRELIPKNWISIRSVWD